MTTQKVLRVGMLTDIDRVDPRQPPEFISSSVLMQVFEPPFSLPCEGRPSQPLLFTGPLQRQPDAAGGKMVYAGDVRPDVTFSDGTPVTAAHVVQSLETTGVLRGEAVAVARGDRVLFTLQRPNARFHLVLTQGGCGVFHERGGKLHGSGPMTIADRGPGLLRLARNDRYRQPVALDAVEIRTYPVDAERRPTALLAAIEAGEVDLCYVLGREDVSRLTKVRKFILPGSSTCFLYFNTESAALRDVELRRALAAAIDRRAVAGISYSNAIAFAAQSPLPPILGSGRDGIQHDPARARELLARAGDRKPRRLTMLRVWGPRPYLPDPVRVGESLVATFAELGIQVDVLPTRDASHYFQQVAAGTADLYLSGWAADTPDPADFLEGVLGSRSIPRPGNLSAHGNLARWASKDMDAALERYRADPAEASWQAVLDLLRDEVPLLPLQYGAAVLAHSWRVRNFTPSPFGWVPLGEVDVRD